MPATATRTAKPQHYARRALRALAVVDVACVAEVARVVVYRIRKNRRLATAGSYVLVDDAGRVFVLSEGAATTEPAVRRNFGWLVGRYASGDSFEFPSVDDIAGDLLDRLSP